MAQLDPKTEAFAGKVLGDTSAMMTVLFSGLGDRLGLFRDLAGKGPATSAELARRAGIHERYAREWLGGMAAAGYLAYDPRTRRYALPPEHAPVLAQENGPVFFGGTHSMLLEMQAVLPRLEQAFRAGGGVPLDAYPPRVFDDMERFTSIWFENLLVQEWLPLVPEVQAALERGIDVADVGCGRGRALLKLAAAFPRSRFVGYDTHAPSIERARAQAREAGLDGRVRFEVVDGAKPLPGTFDLVTTFDVVHDAADPEGMLAAIRAALRPGGTYLNLDINCHERPEQNTGTLAALFYGFSVAYCMTTSLAQGGAGLGTLGLPEARLRELAAKAGFREVRRLPMEDPFNNLYALRA